MDFLGHMVEGWTCCQTRSRRDCLGQWFEISPLMNFGELSASRLRVWMQKLTPPTRSLVPALPLTSRKSPLNLPSRPAQIYLRNFTWLENALTVEVPRLQSRRLSSNRQQSTWPYGKPPSKKRHRLSPVTGERRALGVLLTSLRFTLTGAASCAGRRGQVELGP